MEKSSSGKRKNQGSYQEKWEEKIVIETQGRKKHLEKIRNLRVIYVCMYLA